MFCRAPLAMGAVGAVGAAAVTAVIAVIIGLLVVLGDPVCAGAPGGRGWARVAVEEGDDDQPVAMTGHSLVSKGSQMYVYGGIINWDNGKDVKYGHVLWAFAPEDGAWERCVADRGSRRDNMRLNDSIEVVHKGMWHRGRVLAVDDSNDLVHVHIEDEQNGQAQQGSASHEAAWVPTRSVRYYPPAMNMHIAAIVGNVMYVHGGKGRTGKVTSDLWSYSFDTEAWTHMHPKKDAPAAREMHAAVALDGSVWIHGGSRGQTLFGDLFSYTPRDNTWRQVGAEHSESPWPSARWGHSAVVCGRRMCLYGGHDATQTLSEVWAFDPSTRTWQLVETQGAQPPPRKGHCAAVWSGKMYVFGGNDRAAFLDDTWALDLQSWTWVNVDVGARPPGRNFHRCGAVKGALYAFGGNNNGGLVSDLWSIELQ
eukprot:Opistho-2@46554